MSTEKPVRPPFDPELEVVGIAANGAIAVTKVQQLKPDILTLDVEMPGLDGYETCRRLRDIGPLPVIFATAPSGARLPRKITRWLSFLIGLSKERTMS